MSTLTATPVSQIREITAGGETFMRDGDALLVKSKSTAGVWYRIENATCTCPSYQYRQACRHLTAAAHLSEQPYESPVTVEWSAQFSAWLVSWLGYVHGGTHFDRMGADAHATELRNAEDWERNDWLALHGYGPQRPVLHLVEMV